MSIKQKDGRSLAAAESRIENETQKHCYNADESPDSLQQEVEGKGEAAERQIQTTSKVTADRQVTSAHTMVRRFRKSVKLTF